VRGRPIFEEQYVKGADVINYVIYERTTGMGYDEVMQHKLLGITETAHITLHPDGSVNFRVKRTKNYLDSAIKIGLAGFQPPMSPKMREFISKIIGKI